MIEGQRMDLDKTRYKTFEELELYCYRVAGTVGLMTQGVIGIDAAYTRNPNLPPPDTSRAAIALGIANQLTNILRDVGEDRGCLLYTSPSPRDISGSRMPSSA